MENLSTFQINLLKQEIAWQLKNDVLDISISTHKKGYVATLNLSRYRGADFDFVGKTIPEAVSGLMVAIEKVKAA
jgi:hypothetical protein